jgi:hypothetical protein
MSIFLSLWEQANLLPSVGSPTFRRIILDPNIHLGKSWLLYGESARSAISCFINASNGVIGGSSPFQPNSKPHAYGPIMKLQLSHLAPLSHRAPNSHHACQRGFEPISTTCCAGRWDTRPSSSTATWASSASCSLQCYAGYTKGRPRWHRSGVLTVRFFKELG